MMPVDLAMHLCLSQNQPLRQLLGMPLAKPSTLLSQPIDCPTTRYDHQSQQHSSSSSSSSSSPSSSPEPSSPPRSCFRRVGGSLSKKRVVFADAKGLALTDVHFFFSEPLSPLVSSVLNPSPAKLQGHQQPSFKAQRYKVRLGFPQPTLDLKAFIVRLKETLVQLESCYVTEHAMSGTVRACNISSEKSVHVRVTFDSWRTHQDIPCTFLQQRYGGSDMDVFAFSVAFPQNLDPSERLEFCVSFRPGASAALRWDNNRGQNYRVCVEPVGVNTSQGSYQSVATRRNLTRPAVQRPPSYPLCASVNMKNYADLYSGRFIRQSCGQETCSSALKQPVVDSNKCAR